MDRRPYVITSLNDVPGRVRWMQGVAGVLGDTVQPVVIMWRPHFDVPTHWIVRRMDGVYPGNLDRFLPLLDMDLDWDRWAVFTDGADVSFQRPLPAFQGIDKRVFVAAEGETHGESGFWPRFLRHPLYAELTDKPIYNAGTWAAAGSAFLDFLRVMEEVRTQCAQRGWPVHQFHDQLIFNRWVQQRRSECGELPGLFCTLYANYTGPGFNGRGTTRLMNNRFLTADGQPYAIVHANGSTKHILDALPAVTEHQAPQPALAMRTGE